MKLLSLRVPKREREEERVRLGRIEFEGIVHQCVVGDWIRFDSDSDSDYTRLYSIQLSCIAMWYHTYCAPSAASPVDTERGAAAAGDAALPASRSA